MGNHESKNGKPLVHRWETTRQLMGNYMQMQMYMQMENHTLTDGKLLVYTDGKPHAC